MKRFLFVAVLLSVAAVLAGGADPAAPAAAVPGSIVGTAPAPVASSVPAAAPKEQSAAPASKASNANTANTAVPSSPSPSVGTLTKEAATVADPKAAAAPVPASTRPLPRLRPPDRGAQSAPAAKPVPVVRETKKKTPLPDKLKMPKAERPRSPAYVSPKQLERKTERFLDDVRESYNEGDYAAAEEAIADCLRIDSGNIGALTFKTKIENLKARREKIMNETAEDYRIAAESLFKSGNLLDAMLWVNRSLKLNPSNQKAVALDMAISDASMNVVSNINEKDSTKLMQAIKSFLNEDFPKSVKILRGLQYSYPDTSDLLSVAITHLEDARGSRRSQEYYRLALDLVAKGRYKKAQENLLLALEMDKNNMKARFMLEQVHYELNLLQAQPATRGIFQ